MAELTEAPTRMNETALNTMVTATRILTEGEGGQLVRGSDDGRMVYSECTLSFNGTIRMGPFCLRVPGKADTKGTAAATTSTKYTFFRPNIDNQHAFQ